MQTTPYPVSPFVPAPPSPAPPSDPREKETPDLTASWDGITFTWRLSRVILSVERISERGQTIAGSVTAMTLTEEGKRRLLRSGRLSLVDVNQRVQFAKSIPAMPGVRWLSLLEHAFWRAVEWWRQGEATVLLSEVEELPTRWLLYPFVEHGGPTVLFSPGGTGKSLCLLAMLITASTGLPILGKLKGSPVNCQLFDWETNKYEHASRQRALLAGHHIDSAPRIYYRRMSASLAESVSIMRRDITVNSIGLVAVDSLGFACGGGIETSDSVIRAFNALQSLGVPVIVSSHVNRDTLRALLEGEVSGRVSPFGSVYVENSARLTILVQASDPDPDTGNTILTFTHQKRNNVAQQPPQAYSVRFQTQRIGEGEDAEERTVAITYRKEDVSRLPDANANALSSAERVYGFLRSGARALSDIGTALSLGEMEVGSIVSELVRRGTAVKLSDGRYGLATPLPS